MIVRIRQFLFGTLRHQLIVGVAVVHAVFMTLFVADLIQKQKHLLLNHRIEQAIALSRSLAVSSANSVASLDIMGLQELVDALNGYPDLIFSLVTDDKGMVLAHTDHTRIGQHVSDMPNEPVRKLIGTSQLLVDVAMPVQVLRQHVGWVRVGIAQTGVMQKLDEITRNGILYAFVAILIGSLLAWCIGRRITNRLYVLKSVMDDIRAGDTDVRSALTGSDEVADLSAGFNGMLDKMAQQVTERNMATEAQQKSEERMRLFFERQTVGMAITSPEKGWLQVNDELCRMLGYPPEELYRKAWAEMTYPEDLAADETQFNRLLSGEIDEFSLEKRFFRKDGSVVYTDISVGCVRRPDGSVDYALALLGDITSRKQAEAELLRHRDHLEELVEARTTELAAANERLKEIDRLKSMFIASMSHELRTPLNSVIGFSSILLNEWIGSLNDEQKKSLTSILRSGKHLLSLINDVIDVSKIEAGMIEVSREDFELAELLTEVEQTLAKDAQDRRLSLSIEQISLPMSTDRRRLLQCLFNLVSNGLKFTESGGVTVEVRHDERKRTLTVAVTDTGIGIRVEDQPKLFQPFSRIQSHLSATVLGTGLGLYLTKKIIVEILHGEITVTSELGSGSTFTMSIPVRMG